jgi:hypothetical protein
MWTNCCGTCIGAVVHKPDGFGAPSSNTPRKTFAVAATKQMMAADREHLRETRIE